MTKGLGNREHSNDGYKEPERKGAGSVMRGGERG